MTPTGTPAGSSPATDPIDALDLSEFGPDNDVGGIPEQEGTLDDSAIMGGSTPSVPSDTTETPAASAKAKAKAGPDRGDGRDASGHFASKEDLRRAIQGEAGAIATEEDDAAAEGAATPPDANDPANAPVPFKYRAMGTTHALEGATIDPASGNITIPKAQEGLLREAMNALKVRDVQMVPSFERMTQENTALKARLAEMERGTTEKETVAGSIMDQLNKLLTHPDENEAYQLFGRMRDDFPRLQLEAKAKYWQEQAKRGRGTGQPATAPTTPADRAAAPATEPYRATADEGRSYTTDFIENLAVQVEYRDVTADDWRQYQESLANTPYAFIRPATAADVAQYPDLVLGQDVFDRDLIHTHVTRFVADRRAQRAAAQRTAESKRIAAQNARTTQPTIATPPTTDARASRSRPAPAGAGGGRRITSLEDYNRYMDSDEL